jgi:hypothetical protein
MAGYSSSMPPGPPDLGKLNLVNPVFEKDVKPLLDLACKECHLSLTFKGGFEENRLSMLAAVRNGRMPPKPRFWGEETERIPPYREAFIKVLENYRQ